MDNSLRMQRSEFEVGEQLLEYFKDNFTTTKERVGFLSKDWQEHIPLYKKPADFWESVFDIVTDGALARDAVLLKTLKNPKNLSLVCEGLCVDFKSTTSEIDAYGNHQMFTKNDIFKAIANSVDLTCFDKRKSEDKAAYGVLVTMAAYFALHNNSDYLTDTVDYYLDNSNGYKYGLREPKLSEVSFYVDVTEKMVDMINVHHREEVGKTDIRLKDPKFLNLSMYLSTVSSLPGFIEKIKPSTFAQEGNYLIALSWDELYRDRCHSNFAQYLAVNLALSTRKDEPEIFKKLMKIVPNDLMHKEISFRTPNKIVNGFMFDAVLSNISTPLLQRDDVDVERFKKSFEVLKKEYPYLKKNENTISILADVVQQNTGSGKIKRYDSSNFEMVLNFFDWKEMDNIFEKKKVTHQYANQFCLSKKLLDVAKKSNNAEVPESGGSTFKL